MRYLVFILLCVALSTGNADLTERKTLKFTNGFAKDDPRFTYVNEILNKAFDQLGYAVELISSPGSREVLFAIDRDLDGISGTVPQVLWPRNTTQFIPLKDHSAIATNIAIARKNVRLPKTWLELNQSDLSVVYVRHHYSAKNGLSKENVVTTTTIQQAIKLFLAGRTDVLVGFELNGELSALSEFQTPEFQKPVVLSKNNIYTFINKRYADQAAIFNDNIQQQIKQSHLQSSDLLAKKLLGEAHPQ